MTGPDPGADERGTGAPPRSTGTQGAVGAILIVLALGLALRLFLLYLLPGSGFDADLGSFRFWAANLAEQGLGGFYTRAFFHDYTPGYLYVLWVVGTVGHALGGVGDLIKIPPILSDLAVGYLVWSMIRELGGRERLALLGAAVVMASPIFWFDNVVWGQVDSFGLVFLLLGLRELWRDHPERAAILTVIAAIIKPQLGILVPIVAIVTIRRALWPPQSDVDGDAPPTRPPVGGGLVGALRRWESRTASPIRIVTTGLVGFLTAVVLCAPFGLRVLDVTLSPPSIRSGLVDQIVVAGAGYPFLTVNAYNAWALVPSDLGNSLASSGQWVCDAVIADTARCGAGSATYGPVPAIAIGTVLLLVVLATVLWAVWRRPDRLTILVALSVAALAFFAAPTRVHERYGFPVFALGAILLAVSPRWRVAYVLVTIATFANMYVVLTTLYPPAHPELNPVRDWLTIGELLRSQLGVTVVALLHTAVAVWAWAQLRAGAIRRLAVETGAAALEPDITTPRRPVGTARRLAGDPIPAPLAGGASAMAVAEPRSGPPRSSLSAAGGAAVALPTWSDRRPFDLVGIRGWVVERLRDTPIRADRSRTLLREGGGRFDRLDAWLLVVLILATLGVRLFRLSEPYMMQFDEVYHARTGTEFLQDWRYGISHYIFEWTHPHLAKYAMAGGLVLWGGDHVEATSELGTSIRDAVIEHRREDDSGQRAGERVHVATSDGVETLDLRSRAVLGRIAAPGTSALAIDSQGLRLILGNDDGSLSTLELDLIGTGDPDSEPAPVPLAKVGGAVTHLLVSDDGTTVIASSSDGLVTAIDATTGDVHGSSELDAADLSTAGSGPVLLADPAQIEDPAKLADTLAVLIGGEAIDYESRLADASPGASVVLGSPGSGATRTKIEAAITDGRLAGVQIADRARVAVATKDGVTFIDPTTGGETSTTQIPGGAHGMTLVTRIDQTKLYVTAGTDAVPTYEIIQVAGDEAADGPVDKGSNPLPAPATRIAYDDASQMVHILGRTPDRTGWTVYVVEPHANAVYADARLPTGVEPSAWAMDVEADYQTDDREQLLVFGSEGQVASIDVGSHAFAWRLPGVIAGVLMAACLYLLARVLFHRRSIAVATGLFVLVDGMAFVQSRIGMNDAYVGVFLVAAYLVFAMLWTGWWRSRLAFWLGMPIVGVLLGLALASKWVAAYAIGALALMLLVRSALGRVLAIVGMIGLTSALGYLAIALPGQGAGNVPFLVIMIGLTLLAVIVAIFHPIAWTDEEMWLALVAPTALGAVLFFGSLTLGKLDARLVLGPVAVTPLQLAIAAALGSLVVYGLFRVGAALGYGPMAAPPRPSEPGAVLEAPAPPPSGWLRPGWGFGLPLVWAAVCLAAIPLVIYVASYLPWAAVENHRLWDGYPAGHTGQTLGELTVAMYDYHNFLTSPHPASSPWWAWPFDLKPVWFYQEGFAGATSAATYDAGNLVIWWFGVAGLAFTAIMAFRRRSLALALIAIGFAAQWVSWSRIDRAAFQYHYYTALPFVILALAYLVAELWHGASRRTWAAVRLAGALAVLAPALVWLFSRPLCGLVGVTIVNPGSQACPAVIPEFVLTLQTAALLIVVAAAAYILGRGFWGLGRPADEGDASSGRATTMRDLVISGVGVAIALAFAAVLPDFRLLSWTRIPVEPIALLALLPLAYLAAQVLAARDARRFVVGLATAAVAWFVIWYPNISALPLPSTVVNAYQGVLPTYLYAFQFPVNTAARKDVALLTPTFALLAVALAVTCLVVAYSASTWRLALAESRARAGSGSDDGSGSDASADGFARSGGGA